MIQLIDIRKSYKTGSFVQQALDGVSINFRENEFVAVLGASGSGKTTLLNILGGLDHADSGDILINGVSTCQYKSSDWDTYRNHRIGFIFQSYNLIPHQSVLSNVELALTLSGVTRAERRSRATAALQEVGLGEHINKRPNQLSGGQMQRVAIARALVNDPDIVLADEPTGALDTETGLQVMDLLSNIAKDRLVIMVTHNPELAETYATRIVRLADGRIMGDSRPFEPGSDSVSDGASAVSPLPADAAAVVPAVLSADGAADTEGSSGRQEGRRKTKKASMNFLTALALSFNNLMTKKGRTFMTAFAGSIGIIGIAAILSLSNGVNNYIAKVEEDTLSSYPLTIAQSSYDFTSMLTGDSAAGDTTSTSDTSDQASGEGSSTLIPERTMLSDMFAQIKTNDLSSFKTYLESGQSNIYDYVNTIVYDYDVTLQVFKNDASSKPVQLNPSSIDTMTSSSASSSSAFGSMSLTGGGVFEQMIDDQDLLDSQYDVVEGHWPENYDEAVLVLSRNGSISDYTLYGMGVLDPDQLKDMTEKVLKAEKVDIPDTNVDFSYDDALGTTFKVVNSCNLYTYNAEHGTWTDRSDDEDYMKTQVANGTTLKIVGIVRPNATTSSPALSQGVAYTSDLTKRLMSEAAASDIVKQQKADPAVDVFTGKTFDELKSEEGGSLDFSSMFSIDQDALASAFKFDTSALSASSSGTDIDMSSLSSGMDMTSLMANMPQPDFSSLSSMTLTQSQQSQIAAAQSQIVSGFLPYWYTQHPGESIKVDTPLADDLTAYMQTAAVQASMMQMSAIMGQSTETAVQTAMQNYMTNQFTPYLQNVMQQMVQQMATAMAASVQQQMSSLSNSMGSALSVDSNAFANAIKFNMTQEDLTSLLTNYANSSQLTYDSNMTKLGYAEESNPKTISIYPKDFENKEKVLGVIDDYNSQMKAAGNDDQVISYSDIMGTLMSSVTDIVNMISLVLIAFVSISLVVSSIMIGIITYISVLERKKEIGILRAMGASKRNIANVFNAETIIEGLIAGVFAIAVVLLVSIPVNIWVLSAYQVSDIMSLPWASALALIGVSVLLTFIAGLIPSSAASRRDPVEALRSE